VIRHTLWFAHEPLRDACGLFDRRIKVVFDHIDETTAAGPASTNTGMPPDRPAPSVEERKQLGEWIACGMPEEQDLAP
jgi:hypothetical protein